MVDVIRATSSITVPRFSRMVGAAAENVA